MKLEKQICSFKLAQKLKELKVAQNSLFLWNWVSGQPKIMVGLKKFINQKMVEPETLIFDNGVIAACSAFTSSELGQILPTEIEVDGSAYYLFTFRDKEELWFCVYTDSPQSFIPKILMVSETEVDARAKMLIYLLENNIIDNPSIHPSLTY